MISDARKLKAMINFDPAKLIVGDVLKHKNYLNYIVVVRKIFINNQVEVGFKRFDQKYNYWHTHFVFVFSNTNIVDWRNFQLIKEKDRSIICKNKI